VAPPAAAEAAMTRSANQRGFSLLEILIVTALMAMIALLASNAIKNGLQNKRKIDARLRVESMTFDALRLMSTDIERAFHYQYTLYEIDKQALSDRKPHPMQPNGSYALDPNELPPPPERLTQFIGKGDQIHFTTLNNQRTVANSPESNISEVGYYVNDCKSRLTDKTSKCLWRRSALQLDNDVTRGGESTLLLDNVSLLKFEFLSDDVNDKEWHTQWISDSNGDARTQNNFPQMVRITLEIYDPDSKDIGKFRQTVIASIRFPNNIDPAKRFGGAPKGSTGGANGAGANGGGAGGSNQ
jgi:prepilin-type N-terminal cleavage/methylation domain-containing protein